MLAGLLKNEVAVAMSLKIVDAFVAMRKYISNNLLEQNYINKMVLKHDDEIRLLQNTFSEFENFNNRINASQIPSYMKVNDREGTSLDKRKIYLVSYDKMGFCECNIIY